jgi:hypothetical protein
LSNYDQFNSKAINKDLDHQPPAYRNNLPKISTSNVTNKFGMKEFKQLGPVQIFFFKNGIIIKGFKFSPYYAKEAQSII